MAAKKEFDHVDIIAAIANDPPVIGLKGLAEALDCSAQTLLPRLLPLVEFGRVIKKNLGTEKKPVFVYYLPTEKK